MADTKLSALPAATTPLSAGDLLYVAQGGASKQLAASAAPAALGAAPAWFSGYNSGSWYTPFVAAIATGSVLPANRINFIPFALFSPMTVKAIGARINTLAASGNVQIAVYADLNGQPNGAPMISTGSISTASTGNVTVTLGSPVTLPAGLYWSAINADASAGGVVTVQSVNGSSPTIGWLTGALSQTDLTDTSTTMRAYRNFAFTYATGSWPTLAAAQTTEGLGTFGVVLQLQAN